MLPEYNNKFGAIKGPVPVSMEKMYWSDTVAIVNSGVVVPLLTKTSPGENCSPSTKRNDILEFSVDFW